jgi:PNKP adenylyltransferase domain, ligase domain
MVVKPLGFVGRDRRGLVQPALKTRGREYLRIIYGPEYDLPENPERLRSRGLSAKHSLALREFVFGVEGLQLSRRCRISSSAWRSCGVPRPPSLASASAATIRSPKGIR